MEETAPPIPPAFNGAGFWIRAGARLVDTVFGMFLGVAVGFLCGIVLVILSRAGTISPGWEQRIHGLHLIPFLLSAIGNLGYHTAMEGLSGASVGKWICQLRVLREDGTPVSFGAAAIRSLAYYVDALFFGLIGYSKMKESDLNQRHGDHWADTIVVRANDVPIASRQSSVHLILGFLCGTAFWAACAFIGTLIQAA